jgi:ferredoxin
MSKYKIEVFEENCTGCLRCQLACSDVYTKRFNPSAARIAVIVVGPHCQIDFKEDCNDCGVCADDCFYGALEKTEKEDG